MTRGPPTAISAANMAGPPGRARPGRHRRPQRTGSPSPCRERDSLVKRAAHRETLAPGMVSAFARSTGSHSPREQNDPPLAYTTSGTAGPGASGGFPIGQEAGYSSSIPHRGFRVYESKVSSSSRGDVPRDKGWASARVREPARGHQTASDPISTSQYTGQH